MYFFIIGLLFFAVPSAIDAAYCSGSPDEGIIAAHFIICKIDYYYYFGPVSLL